MGERRRQSQANGPRSPHPEGLLGVLPPGPSCRRLHPCKLFPSTDCPFQSSVSVVRQDLFVESFATREVVGSPPLAGSLSQDPCRRCLRKVEVTMSGGPGQVGRPPPLATVSLSTARTGGTATLQLKGVYVVASRADQLTTYFHHNGCRQSGASHAGKSEVSGAAHMVSGS